MGKPLLDRPVAGVSLPPAFDQIVDVLFAEVAPLLETEMRDQFSGSRQENLRPLVLRRVGVLPVRGEDGDDLVPERMLPWQEFPLSSSNRS